METFDLDSVTLGELVEVELASGKDVGDLLKSRTGRILMARYLLAWRKHEQDTSSPLPQWEGDRRPLELSKSSSPTSPDGGSET